MKIPSLQEIKDYYPTYLKAHTNRWNRRLHIVGNLATVGYFILILGLAFKWSLWLLAGLFFTPFVVYFFAWPAHKLIEKNEPATWYVNPLITKSCDWIMIKDIFTGKIPF